MRADEKNDRGLRDGQGRAVLRGFNEIKVHQGKGTNLPEVRHPPGCQAEAPPGQDKTRSS